MKEFYFQYNKEVESWDALINYYYSHDDILLHDWASYLVLYYIVNVFACVIYYMYIHVYSIYGAYLLYCEW